MSIRAPHVGAIFRGEKTVELRRRPPRLLLGDLVVIYETAPAMMVCGVVEVRGTVAGPPAALRARFLDDARVSAPDFDGYFGARGVGAAILLGRVHALPRRLTLADLRRLAPSFHPPQSWVSLEALAPPVRRLLRYAVRQVVVHEH